MTMLLVLAWRNIWRNARRTLITMLALALGVLGIVFLHSYRESMYGQLVQGITAGLMGDLQVHGRGYQETPSVETVVKNPAVVEARLAQALPGAKTERRVFGAGLAGAGDNSEPVVVIGTESGSALRTIVEGRDTRGPREAVLGTALADDLGVKPGQEVVVVGQAADGSVANDRYTVVGTAESGSVELNASALFLSLADAQAFFGLEDGVHQIIVRLPEEKEDFSSEVSTLRGALDLATLEALSWTEMLPEMKATMAQKRSNQHIVDLIVFLIVALGVLNAITMSTFERTHELGLMAALGTRRTRILSLVMTESLLQGLVGFAAGLAVALALLYGIGTIHMAGLSSTDLMGARLPETVTLTLNGGAVASAAITSFLTVTLGALIPAVRAARLQPVDAMRHV